MRTNKDSPHCSITNCFFQGIVHAGAVLDPGVITNIALSSLRNEFGGKVEGPDRMAESSVLAPLTAFNLFSSLAAFSGSGGQGSYAAANGCSTDGPSPCRGAPPSPPPMSAAQTSSSGSAAEQRIKSEPPRLEFKMPGFQR